MNFKVNIVDDEEDINSILKLYLEREGYIVNSFFDGNTAMENSDPSPDLWIIDIMLPGINGYTLLKKIKKSDSNIPVIFISAKNKELDRVIGLEMGSDDYISKPFLPRELVLKVNNLLKLKYGSSENHKESKVIISDYIIDKDRCKVFLNDIDLELTMREFRLLTLLVDNMKIPLSREQILEKIWDESYFGSHRVVDDTIRRIRKKMPEINIETIYNFGYELTGK